MGSLADYMAEERISDLEDVFQIGKVEKKAWRKNTVISNNCWTTIKGEIYA